MIWNLPFDHAGFPAGVQQSLLPSLAVDDLDLYWSAVTVGRPNLLAAMAHGSYSRDEILWRCGIVDANVVRNNRLSGLYNSTAFNALDATEKGWINFSLGMMLTKLCADQLLGMPWLLHFKWFHALHPVTKLPGGSTPDFLGFDPFVAQFHALEAKGRNAGFSTAAMTIAKTQALQAIAVGSLPCVMHIGSLLYRQPGGRLAMAMEDPVADGSPRKIEETQSTWAEYYRVVWEWTTRSADEQEGLRRLLGLTIKLDPHARPYIEALMTPDNREWRRARDGLFAWSIAHYPETFEADGSVAERQRTFRDGVVIGYTPTAPERAMSGVLA